MVLATLLAALETEWDTFETLVEATDAEDRERQERQAGLRWEEGQIDLDNLGSEAWMEFFRYAALVIKCYE